MIKTGIIRVNTFANALCADIQGRTVGKAQRRVQGYAEKAKKGGDAERGRKHHRVWQLPQTNESPVCYLCRFRGTDKKDSTLRETGRGKESYTEKTEWHEACGYAYTVVRNDGFASTPNVYRGENAVEKFLKDMLQEERKIRESLSAPSPLVMTKEHWEKQKTAKDTHLQRMFDKGEVL